jgi:hypothetical protein
MTRDPVFLRIERPVFTLKTKNEKTKNGFFLLTKWRGHSNMALGKTGDRKEVG